MAWDKRNREYDKNVEMFVWFLFDEYRLSKCSGTNRVRNTRDESLLAPTALMAAATVTAVAAVTAMASNDTKSRDDEDGNHHDNNNHRM